MRRQVLEVKRELHRAIQMYPPMRSVHEGYAILQEEVDELWDAIKQKKHDSGKIRTEAIQVAAMAIRLVVDCCDAK